jgi:hypothetical protein
VQVRELERVQERARVRVRVLERALEQVRAQEQAPEQERVPGQVQEPEQVQVQELALGACRQVPKQDRARAAAITRRLGIFASDPGRSTSHRTMLATRRIRFLKS